MQNCYEQDEVVEITFDTLMSQPFAEWYEGEFMDFISGESSASRDDIRKEIKTKFFNWREI